MLQDFVVRKGSWRSLLIYRQRAAQGFTNNSPQPSACCATPLSHCAASYRNDTPARRQVISQVLDCSRRWGGQGDRPQAPTGGQTGSNILSLLRGRCARYSERVRIRDAGMSKLTGERSRFFFRRVSGRCIADVVGSVDTTNRPRAQTCLLFCSRGGLSRKRISSE